MIVTWDYFNCTYIGQGVSPTDFPRLNVRAEDMIDALVNGALKNFDTFAEDVKTLVRKAICAQIEYYGQYSTEVGFEEERAGFTVGKVSVQNVQQAGSKTYISPMAISYLERTGLMSRVVGVRC